MDNYDKKYKKHIYQRVVLLNQSVITAEGKFIYKVASLSEIVKMVQDYNKRGIEVLSAIGHKSTSQLLSDLLGFRVKVNRVEYKQTPEDICVIFKLNKRLEEGKILSKKELENIGYKFGLLIMER